MEDGVKLNSDNKYRFQPILLNRQKWLKGGDLFSALNL
jgi:hypothetical protein